MRDRLREYIRYKGITPYRFAKDCGLINTFFHGHCSGVSGRSLAKIESVYPDLNMRWVTTGEGAMLRDINSETVPLTKYIDDMRAKDDEIARLKEEVRLLKKVSDG